MKPAPFIYHDPTTVDELLGLLARLEDAKLLAGGQSLVPMLGLRFVVPDHVVDLNTVAGLDGLEDDGAALQVGAMTRQRRLLDSEDVARRIPLMREALRYVGHFQTRSRGTLGGSLCHLDPSAELPLVALLHDAALTVRGPQGARTVEMRDWALAYMTPSLAPEEVLTHVSLGYWTEPHGGSFVEFARRHGDFAIVAVGCLLAVEGGAIRRAAIAVGGAQAVPYRLRDAEQALLGQPPSADTFEAAAAVAARQEAMTDAYVSSGYRQRLARVLTERALTEAAARAAATESR